MKDVIFIETLEPGMNGLNMAEGLLRRLNGFTKRLVGPNQLERVERGHAAEMVERHIVFIKNDIKKRIHIYDPLKFKLAFQAFLQWLREEDYKRIKEMPENLPEDEYLSGLIRDFLIRGSYYALEERYIKHRVMNKLGTPDDNNIKLMEIVDFIIDGVEKDDFKRLKYFREEARFKTFFSTVVSSLFNDYWRRHYKIAKEVTKYEPDFNDAFDNPLKNPEENMLHIEHQQDREAAAKLLPDILARLTAEESFAVKMKFEKGMKISPIARTLGRSDYKTKQFIKQTVEKISREIAQKIKRGDYHDPS